MDSRFIQFDNANKINGLMDRLLPLITIDTEAFRRDYFDIDTCLSDGLDNWGRILMFTRVITINTATNGVFGFGIQSDYPIAEDEYPQNFNNGFFYNPTYDQNPVQYTLLDYEYRIALKFRYSALTTNLSMKAINTIMNVLLQNLNSSYKCVVTQTDKMELTYKFNFDLLPWLKALFTNRDILPVPAGVTAILLERQII